MDTNTIRNYATRARKSFFEAIAARARFLGITAENPRPSTQPELLHKVQYSYHPRELDMALEELHELFRLNRFVDVIEKTSYTWFNRLVALRYMEVNGFLPVKVLSESVDFISQRDNSDNPEAFFKHSQHRVNLKQLWKEGRSPDEVYRSLLMHQCNELHNAMPFLFEEITPGLALLLPDDLATEGSLIRDLVDSIPARQWQDGVEIIGWLYQYYIAEKRKELSGRVLTEKEIPAATQLFTPRWIVRYMVQNTLGKKWLENRNSPVCRSRWEYVMPERESTKGFNARNIEPETITVLDPACGSGHILVEAYDTLRDIYLECGYSPSEIPYKVLEHNLYGLDIDERATQMASFALLMRAGMDEPSILDGTNTPVPNIFALNRTDYGTIIKASESLLEDKSHRVIPFTGKTRLHVPSCANSYQLAPKICAADFTRLAGYFNQVDTIGSLIKIPESERSFLTAALHFLNHKIASGDLFQRKNALSLVSIVLEAFVLSSKFDCVVANPPYMGAKYQPQSLRTFIKDKYGKYGRDLFSAFIIRNLEFTKPGGSLGFMSPFVWMFLGTYQNLREILLENTTISSLIKLQYSAFEGATVPVCTFTLKNEVLPDYEGCYINLEDFKGKDTQSPKVIEAINSPDCSWIYFKNQSDFFKLPNKCLSFWLEDNAIKAFENGDKLGDFAPIRVGLQTSDNSRFLRRWYEVKYSDINFHLKSREELSSVNSKWVPYNKGGKFRKWYGNHEYVLFMENDGQAIKQHLKNVGRPTISLGDPAFQFIPGITWSDVSSGNFGARYLPSGFLSDISGSGIFPEEADIPFICCFLCSSVATKFIEALNPTLHFQTGNVASIPLPDKDLSELRSQLKPIFQECVRIMKDEWSEYEENWQFQALPYLPKGKSTASVESLISSYLTQRQKQSAKLQQLEFKNDCIFAKAFNLPEPTDSSYESKNSTYPKLTVTDCVKRLISYCVGLILGRYQLGVPGICDQPGKNSFSVKESYVIFEKSSLSQDQRDIFKLFHVLLKRIYGAGSLQENLDFIAANLSPNDLRNSESIIREYFYYSFFKDHCKQYSKKPIYWEISNGNRGSVRALLYYHLYSPVMLKSLRDSTLVPKITALKSLESSNDTENLSRFARSRLQKERVHLENFLERLNLLISEKITLELDEGIVKNYTKLSSILGTSSDVARAA